MRSSHPRFVLVVLAAAVFALGVGASQAQPAPTDAVTISMLAGIQQQPGWTVLISNFERVYHRQVDAILERFRQGA
jgi:hypothetical protein